MCCECSHHNKQKTNNTGADQAARMSRLICSFVVRMQQNQGFLRRGTFHCFYFHFYISGAQWLSGRVLDSRPKGRGFEPHRRLCIVCLSKNINPSFAVVQHREARPYVTKRLLMGRKKSNQIKKIIFFLYFRYGTKKHRILDYSRSLSWSYRC